MDVQQMCFLLLFLIAVISFELITHRMGVSGVVFEDALS